MTKKNGLTVVGLGEILWDILPGGKQLGGAPANFAYHAQALGAEAIPVSCVGDDENGKEILSQLQKLGLNRNYIAIDKNHHTGYVTVKLDKAGQPDYTIHEDVAWDFIPSDEKLPTLAQRADAVCFGSLCQRCETSRSTIGRVLETAGDDCLCIFDINLRQSYYNRQIIEKSLQYTDVLKLNDEELPVLARLLELTGTQADLLSRLTRRYELRMIALTRGPNGSLLYGDGKTCDHEGFHTEVIDTVGAGDAFTAAITIGLLNNKTMDEINESANHLAGFVCSQAGATPKLPAELLKLPIISRDKKNR